MPPVCVPSLNMYFVLQENTTFSCINMTTPCPPHNLHGHPQVQLTLALSCIRDPLSDQSAGIVDYHGLIKLRGEGGGEGGEGGGREGGGREGRGS